jgi:ABC-type antimicrobial peptide transport system permease subunit
MIWNYLKITWRNLYKNKSFSLINIVGLAIGMASAMLILLWIENEISYDQFHEKKDRIYEVWNRAEFSGEMQNWKTTPKILARTLEKDFPEVEMAARVNQYSMMAKVGNERVRLLGNIVDSNFLDIFSIPLVKGNIKQALLQPHHMAITETTAKKLFGNEDPMGKQVTAEGQFQFTISAIIKDQPNNTRFIFDYLVPWDIARKTGMDDTYWGNNSTRTYVLLRENASIDQVNQKLKTFKKKYDPSDPNWQYFLYPISRWRLYSYFEKDKESGGLIEFVRMFGIIAAFILLIACINFMNLSTARSEKRAREVGIRKVAGANRASLIRQFLGESVLIAIIAGIIGLYLVYISLPAFNELTGKKLSLAINQPIFWLFFLGFVLFTGVLAGSYPAFYLSSFLPVKVLKGTFQKTRALVTPRKVMVTLQFTFAIILIICTLVVKQQIDHARNRNTGYDRDQMVYHFLSDDITKNYSLIKQELLASGVATSVTKCSAPITEAWSDTWGIEWEGKDPNDKTDFDRYCVDEGIVTTAGLQLVQGRDFDLRKFPTDSAGVLLNESAVKAMGFNNPIGKTIKDNDRDWHVVGVVKDFVLQSPYQPTKPMVIEGAYGWFNVVNIKLKDGGSSIDNIGKVESIFKKYNPDNPVELNFVDEAYENKFKSEKRTGTLAALFAGLTIFISCLGLFGLAAYMAETRTKEIGVRKVLGASVTGLITLLSRDFIKLVIISFLIASPIAWWFMYNWLEKYPYRVNIQWWIFAATAGTAIMIALLTVSFHAIKAAMANPVKSLRSE